MKERFLKIKEYLPKHKKIADLGIGKGYYWNGEDTTNVIGVDLNEKNIRKLKTHSPDVKVFIRDIVETGLPDKEFDLVILSQVIEHIEDQKSVIDEAKRICKDDGYLLIGTPLEDHHKLHFYPVWELKDIIELGNKFGEVIELKKLSNSWLMYVKKS